MRRIAGCRGTNASPLARDKTLQTRVGSAELRFTRRERKRETGKERRVESKRKQEDWRGLKIFRHPRRDE